jgi:DNA-binding response OmpR family regulator
MNILIVDDDIDVQTFLEHFLRAEGYTVHSAGDGREALCKLKEKVHNMVFFGSKNA